MRAPGRSTRWRIAAVVVLALAHWLTHLSFPEPAAAGDLDASHSQAVGVALKEGLAFGREIVFTTGPLGWFNRSPYDPDLDLAKVLGWEIVLELAVSTVFALVLVRLGFGLALAACAFAALVPRAGNDAWALLAILAFAIWTLVPIADREQHATRRALTRIAFAALISSLLALVKFTYLLYSGTALACVLVVLATRHGLATRRGPATRRGIATALCAAALAIACFVAVWTAIGQDPTDIPAYIATSLALSSAYSSAQSLPAPPGQLELAFVVLALAALGLALELARRPRSIERTSVAALIAAGLFLAFKAGFVRPAGSQITFFAFAAAAPWLVRTIGAARSATSARDPAPDVRAANGRGHAALARGALLAHLATTIVALAAFSESERAFERTLLATSAEQCAREIGTLLHPFAARAERESSLAARRREFALPRSRAVVGDAPTEVFGSEQGILFLNELAWRPRPVFQDYSVFTSALSAANARFLESESAPRFVLFTGGTIDERMPTMQDFAALAVLLRDYRPRLAENGFVLLERRPDAPHAASDVATALARDTARIGDAVELGDFEGGALVLRIEIRPTFAGRVRTLLHQAEALLLEVADEHGARASYRLVPTMIDGGALVAPWLRGREDWLDWFAGEPVPRAVRFTVRAADGALDDFAPAFAWSLERRDALVPDPDPEGARRMRYSMFATPPDAIESAHPPFRELLRRRLEVLVVPPPASLTWTVAPGAWSVRGGFGILGAAWIEGDTDGARFRVELVEEGREPRVLLERSLDPERVDADRRLQSLEVDFEVERDARLVLATDPGPAGDDERDWTFWTGIEIVRR